MKYVPDVFPEPDMVIYETCNTVKIIEYIGGCQGLISILEIRIKFLSEIEVYDRGVVGNSIPAPFHPFPPGIGNIFPYPYLG